MLATRFIRRLRAPVSVRQFNLTAGRRDGKPTVSESSQASKPGTNTQESTANTQGILGGHMHTVNAFDRWMLVWVKRYKNKAEVPVAVTHECILAARSKARIKTCNYMIGVSILGFIWAVISGKRDSAAGLTIERLGEERLKRLQEEGKAERARAAAAAAKAEAS